MPGPVARNSDLTVLDDCTLKNSKRQNSPGDSVMQPGLRNTVEKGSR